MTSYPKGPLLSPPVERLLKEREEEIVALRAEVKVAADAERRSAEAMARILRLKSHDRAKELAKVSPQERAQQLARERRKATIAKARRTLKRLEQQGREQKERGVIYKTTWNK